jgi:hypothetical protein
MYITAGVLGAFDKQLQKEEEAIASPIFLRIFFFSTKCLLGW